MHTCDETCFECEHCHTCRQTCEHGRYCEMCDTWTTARECVACGMPTVKPAKDRA